MRGYSIGDTLKNIISLVYTRIIWRNARLVRLPVLARNRQNILYGTGFTCGTGCRMNPGIQGKILIGNNVIMGDYCQIEAMKKVSIGNDVLIASKVYIGDASHGNYSGENQSPPSQSPHDRCVTAKPVVIGNNVWIGNAVTIIGGVTVGDGAVIGANAVVTRDVKENMIVVGNPAKAVKKYDKDSGKWKRVSGN